MTEAVMAPLEDAKTRMRMKQGISSPKRSTHWVGLCVCVCVYEG